LESGKKNISYRSKAKLKEGESEEHDRVFARDLILIASLCFAGIPSKYQALILCFRFVLSL
jgi:hypothetical protein